MNRSHFHKLPLVACVASVSLLTSVVQAAPPTVTVITHAADLQARSDYYAQLATFYRERALPGTKHLITYFTAANRADGLAKRYHLAAAEAGNHG